MPTIALVDDDANILTSLSIALELEGYRVTTYSDGFLALQGLQTSPPDLAILDIKMPHMDGMELLRRLRKNYDKPVIFLTSKEAESDELSGFQCGADDFIRKPFSQRLLSERIKVLLRRTPPRIGADSEKARPKTVQYSHLYIDPECHACTWKGKPLTLTITEFLILRALASRPGIVKSREALIEAAYREEDDVLERTIDSHIKHLRRRFREVDGRCDPIETLYGVGYRFRETGVTDIQTDRRPF